MMLVGISLSTDMAMKGKIMKCILFWKDAIWSSISWFYTLCFLSWRIVEGMVLSLKAANSWEDCKLWSTNSYSTEELWGRCSNGKLLSLPPFSMHLASGQLFWINVFASLSLCRTCGCLTFKDTKRYLVHKSRPSIRYRETIFKLYSLKRILKMTSLSPYYVIYSNALTTNARECLKGYWRWYHWVHTT